MCLFELDKDFSISPSFWSWGYHAEAARTSSGKAVEILPTASDSSKWDSTYARLDQCFTLRALCMNIYTFAFYPIKSSI